ncbi:MAG: hypothetical protein QGH83_01410 [Candidatus Pacebacteria bacterium]|jgi:hypothetical protein|nr:hypothetical protein [Candidatus Paceibacterota bacterium]
MKGFKRFVERPLSPEEERKKEEIVLALKKKKSEFVAKHGSRAKAVMYATATKLAKGGK